MASNRYSNFDLTERTCTSTEYGLEYCPGTVSHLHASPTEVIIIGPEAGKSLGVAARLGLALGTIWGFFCCAAVRYSR